MNGKFPFLVVICRPNVCVGKWAINPSQHESLEWVERRYIAKTCNGIKPIRRITRFVSLTVDGTASLFISQLASHSNRLSEFCMSQI